MENNGQSHEKIYTKILIKNIYYEKIEKEKMVNAGGIEVSPTS